MAPFSALPGLVWTHAGVGGAVALVIVHSYQACSFSAIVRSDIGAASPLTHN